MRTITTVIASVAGTVAFLAAVPAAVEAVRDGAGWVKDVVSPEDPPSTEEKVVDEFVDEVKRTMDWHRPPAIYRPSLDRMRRDFSVFDPRRVHSSQAAPSPQFARPIGDLVDRAPQTAGLVIETWGKITHRTQVKLYDDRVVSWALQLREPGIVDSAVICRVPLGASASEPFRIGQYVAVLGVAVAEGGVPRADAGGSIRILYLACSHAKAIRRPSRP